MPAKAGIQVRDFPGFRVALAIASLPGMTAEFCMELRVQDTSTKIALRSVFFLGIGFVSFFPWRLCALAGDIPIPILLHLTI
jgi:hypothetical protein